MRDFDKALSMVANGFESLEDFYANCATRDVIGEVKIPVLFIQVIILALKLCLRLLLPLRSYTSKSLTRNCFVLWYHIS